MEISKSKLNIIGLIALVVVCTGSFIGVRAMNSSNRVEASTVPSVYQAPTESTTAPAITQAPMTVPTTAFDTSTTLNIEAVITTFPITTTEPTTTEPVVTEPVTEPTTEATTKKVTTTRKITTTKKVTTTRQVTQQTTGKNAAVFDEGVAGYKYDKKGNFYYTSSDPWQRQFGYHEAFDVAASFVSIYMDTMRCKFEYGGKDWMIQFWKGQYGYVFVGHEIGVYYKPIDRTAEHYDCVSDDDSIYMEMNGLRNGEILYSRDYGKYWWCTGFVPGKLKKFSDRSELQIDARLTMKDKDMLAGFVGALEQNGMIRNQDYTVKGLDVYVIW